MKARNLVDYVIEGFVPGKYIPDGQHFWDRYSQSLMKDPRIRDRFYDENGNRLPDSERLEEKLKNIVVPTFDYELKDYVKRSPNLIRYAATGVTGLGVAGVVTGLASLALGAPVAAAVAGIGVALGTILKGGILGTAADIKEAHDADQAIAGTYESGKHLGYLARTAKGAWEFVKGALNPMTYVHNARQLAEGVFYRTAAYLGPAYVSPYMLAAPLLDHYRGAKKFEQRVINHFVDKSLDQFTQSLDHKISSLTREELEQHGEVIEKGKLPDSRLFGTYRSPRVTPLKYALTSEGEYTLVTAGEPKNYRYVEPRMAS